MPYTLCLDIGATKIAGALIDERSHLSRFQKIPTQAQKNNKIIINNIFFIINKLIRNNKIKSINIGIAGQIDHKKGIIIKSHNFNKKFKNIKIKKILEESFHLPVYMDNDVNCFALGEAIYGLGKKHDIVIGMTLGSGVGGGIVINKKIYHGKNNLAGEFGHMIIKNKIWERSKQNIRNINWMAQALYNILHILDPDIIIIGGGISNMPQLIAKAKQKLNKPLYYQAFKQTKIVKSRLQTRANLLGAYLLTTICQKKQKRLSSHCRAAR